MTARVCATARRRANRHEHQKHKFAKHKFLLLWKERVAAHVPSADGSQKIASNATSPATAI